jgi:hypothetical protein
MDGRGLHGKEVVAVNRLTGLTIFRWFHAKHDDIEGYIFLLIFGETRCPTTE